MATTTPHYAVLDGLRGTAAIAIVVFHFTEFAYPDYAANPIGHGFLAVDFFFCLSGFVIGHAYDHRLRTMTVRQFLRQRLIRLHPLVLLGALLGLAAFLLDPWSTSVAKAGAANIALACVAAMLMVPAPILPDRGGGLFPLNPPTWSLFWEYAINLAYILGLGRLRTPGLALVALAGAAGLLLVAAQSGSLIGGWGISNIWDGLPRVLYSFTAGLIVHRLGWRWRGVGFVPLSLLLIVLFAMPYWPGNGFIEAALVILGFPLIVALGAGAADGGRQRGLCLWLGRLSYPLYMTHNAVMFPFGNYLAKHPMSATALWSVIAIGTAALCGAAALAMRLYDEPVRAWLAGRGRAISRPA